MPSFLASFFHPGTRGLPGFLFKVMHLLCAAVLLTACLGQQPMPVTPTGASPAETPTPQPKPTALTYSLTEILFQVMTPSELAEDQDLYIELMDEVTGLALNTTRVKMQSEDKQNFAALVPVVLGSVLKYRYVRSGSPMEIEYTSLGSQVRYRLYSVEGPGTVRDTITAWKSEPTEVGLGRIDGRIFDKATNSPIVNALVVAGGMAALSSSTGSFLLEGLPPGTHNLVAYSMDGSFRTFQQGAVVATESTTPVEALVEATEKVTVTFLVRPPEDNLEGVPVRLVGNLYSLGNTFADLRGGVSVLASRAPYLSVQPDGRYALSLQLPVGHYLTYKYTLGDGFWNAERASNGAIRLRQLIVPDQDITIEDSIYTWKIEDYEPVSFAVTVPDNTPVTDTVSIQFNPYGWTEPIPMWPLGNNRWFYILYNPLDLFDTASYRYCRNEQCGTLDAADTRGPKAAGHPFKPSSEPQDFQDTVETWAWLEPAGDPVVVSAGEIEPNENFQAGVEWVPAYHPSWQPYLASGLQNIKDIGANSVIFSPTWHLTHKIPPVIEPVAGKDPLWFDWMSIAEQAQQRELKILLHPAVSFNEDPQTWWETAKRDEGWWQSWFDRYRTYVLYHADLAEAIGAEALILGDENIMPAMPGGKLADGTSSGIPTDAINRWTDLIDEIRTHFDGDLAWLVPYAGAMPTLPTFITRLDWAYVEMSAPLAGSDDVDADDLAAAVSEVFDGDLTNLQKRMGSSIRVGLKYPSARGSFDGCVEAEDGCLAAAQFDLPGLEDFELEMGGSEQADAFNALLSAINGREWVDGFFAVGYYPPAETRDYSHSVRGKPASDMLWYWFPRLLGVENP